MRVAVRDIRVARRVSHTDDVTLVLCEAESKNVLMVCD
jgi:hypothetical protein